jgi:hypothetical protein
LILLSTVQVTPFVRWHSEVSFGLCDSHVTSHIFCCDTLARNLLLCFLWHSIMKFEFMFCTQNFDREISKDVITWETWAYVWG